MGRTPKILILATSAWSLVLGCKGGTGSPTGTSGGSTTGALSNEPAYASSLREAAQESPLYSISFDEQGPFLLTYFPVTATPFICDEGMGGFPPGSATLTLWTPLASGTFAVGPSNSDIFPPTSGQAVAEYHGGNAEAPIEILPTTGQVVITSAPANADGELAGAHLAGSFHLGYPAISLYPDCFGDGEFFPDGGFSNSSSWCLCKDATGNTVSVCDGGEMSQCCVASGPASFFLDGTFDAAPCGALCIDPPFSGLCEPLWPDAGAS